MRYIFFLLILLISILLCSPSYAEFTQFNFSLNRYIIRNDEDVSVNFSYLLSGYEEKDFLVRPVIEGGLIEILDEDSSKWISSYDYLFNLPSLKEKMRVRVKGLEQSKSSLYFEVFNTMTGKVFETPKKDIWTNKIYLGYLEKVNDNLIKISSLKEIINEIRESTESFESVTLENGKKEKLKEALESIPKTHFLLLGLGIFLVSIVISLKISVTPEGNRDRV